MSKKVALLFLVVLSLGLQAKPIKVMLLTGQTDKYHKWDITSSYLEAVLKQEKRFVTEKVLIPAPGKAFDEFVPDFSSFQVVVLAMNLPE